MQYERLSHVEHILKRPDTYVGSLAPELGGFWARSGDQFSLSQLSIAPGLVKIFDEILVNAIDQHSLHPKKVSEISVKIEKDSILVRNSGVAVPIKKHATGKGNAGKHDMVEAMQLLGHPVTDDNEADALALLHWALEVQSC